MKILIDENIPYAEELFSRLGDVKTVSGRSISTDELDGADALIIRSVTKIDRALLIGKTIRFVGTVTTGIDHIDRTWLKQAGISFSYASGCNAISVVEYIFSVLLVLAERENFSLKDRIIGIVGMGNIGRCLKKRLDVLGFRTIFCDIPHVVYKNRNNCYSLHELVKYADILTFHIPLCKDGPYKTLHMVDETLIRRMKPGTILINTCRGSVVDNTALLACLESGQQLNVALDVWESEPDLNISLLNRVDIGTAHIAGYTLEGKIRSTIKIFRDYSTFIGKPQQIQLEKFLPIPEFSYVTLHGSLHQHILKRLVHLIYDVRQDDAMLRKVASISGEFDKLRNNYFNRREWSSLYVVCDTSNTAILLKELGFNAIYNQIIN